MGSPKQFGPFILDRMIGRGGMGAVYRATHEKTGQVVAVKALLLPLEQERERFEAEISTLRLLRHENIVKLYGFGQEDGVLYYAMEYVDGRAFRSYRNADGALPGKRSPTSGKWSVAR